MTGGPVHDRDQIQEPTLNRDVGDVGAPDLIGSVDHQIPEQIRVNPVSWVGVTGSRRLIDRLQSHQPHQASNAMTTDADTFAAQLTHHLAGAVKRILEEQLVNTTHQRQVPGALALRGVIERRPADRQNFALTAQAQIGVIASDHAFAFPPAHRLSPLAKKSRSTVNWPILACRSWTSDSRSRRA